MSNQHVQIPNGTTENVTSEQKKPDKKYYTDLFVYAILKKYMISESGISLVSLRKIAEETSISLGGVQSAIKRLEEAKDIEKVKITGKNQNGYKFNPTSKKFEMFDKQFLDNKILTPHQKSFMITMQQHLFIDKQSGIGKTTYSSKELSEKTGLSERVINERRRELEISGFISRRTTTDKDGNACEALEFNLPKFGQYILCKLEETEKNMQDIQERMAGFEMEINKMKGIIKMQGVLNIEDINEIEL